MRRNQSNDADELQARLRDDLRALSESVTGDPPEITALTRLVERVNADERRREARELAQFLACAIAVVGGGLLLLARRPVYYAALQAILAVPCAIAALIWFSRRKRVTE